MSLHYLPAARLAELVRRREVSARELTEAHLSRIAAMDGGLGAFLHVDADGARARADEIDRAVARRDDVGPLGGVPMAVKDIFVTRAVPTTAGSRILEGWRPPYDGTVVARLRQAGAVLLGKLNMDEFAMGSSNESSAFRPCKNPWDETRVPGGSSGGSAAAVAAGLCAGSLGTDTGGSVRQPASLCGVVGLKPTYGRVSRYGVIAFASSLDQVGPLARTVEDTALLLEVIAGHDPHDATSIPALVPRYRDDVARGAADGIDRLVVGLPREYFVPGMDPEVDKAVRAAVARMEQLGARVREISLPHTSYAVACYYLVATAEASSNLARYDGVRYGLRRGGQGSLAEMNAETRGEGFGAEVKRRIMLGTYVLRSGYYDAYYRKAQQVRTLIKRDFDRAFAEVDVIAAPVSPSAAFLLGEKTDDPLAMYLADIFTIGASLAGLPAMSVPCGFTAAGLPIGLQLVGRTLDEPALFRAAGAYERSCDWELRRPVP
jgi:aspartyl-tRNA(Asn)/glutamyl-tRNA(Gln) amidotransferase subunit A